MTAAHAEHDKNDGKREGKRRGTEFKMKVSKRGDRYYGHHNNREYQLRGDVRFSTEGEYTVYGDIGDDNTYITTYESAPLISVHTGGRNEYRMHVTRRGDRYYGHHNNREYILRGDGARFTSEGEYTVYGDISTDGTYIETREVRPVVVVQEEVRPVVREVIIERRDPLIKIGPLEIGR